MTMKKILSVLCAAIFLSSVLIPVQTAVAAEDWPVWPRKPAAAPPEAPAPAPAQEEKQKKEAAAVLDTGGEAGQKAAAGTSAGTVGLYALGGALLVGGIIAIAGGGGGGSSSNH